MLAYQSTLPNNGNMPAGRHQCVDILPIPFHRAPNLGLPELRSCFREHTPLATRMAVPEAAVHEDDCLVFGKHNIRPAREIADVLPEPKASFVEQRSDCLFNPGLFPSHARHGATALFRGHEISHSHSPAKRRSHSDSFSPTRDRLSPN